MARVRLQHQARHIGVPLAGAMALFALGCGEAAGRGQQAPAAAGQGGDGASGGVMLGEGAGGSSGSAASGGGEGGGAEGGGGEGGGAEGGGVGSVGGGGASSDPYAPTITKSDGCVPKGPPLEEVAGARLVREAESINDIDTLGVFNGALYFAESREGIRRIAPPTAGYGSAELVSEYGSRVVWALVVAGDQLFTVETNSRELWRASLATLPATPELFNAEANVNEKSLLADDTNLYFSSWNRGIYALPHAAAPGTAPTQLVPDINSSQMALADGYLYYVHASRVSRVAVTGGEPELVAGIASPRSVTVSDGIAYVVSSESVRKVVSSEALSHTLLATGSPISPTSQYHQELDELKATTDRIYFRQEDGSLGWVTKDGSDCRLVVDLNEPGIPNPVYAITDTHYYLIIDDNRLYEIAR